MAYVQYARTDILGVTNRTRAMARATDQNGMSHVDFFVINPHEDRSLGRLRYVRTPPSRATYLDRLLRRYRLIERSVDLSIYDRIVLRYCGADFSGPGFSRRHFLVTEHHTKEQAELTALLRQGSSSFKRIGRKSQAGLEQACGAATLRGCRGLIAMTDEIARYEVGRSDRALSSCVVANGIDVEAITPTGFEPFDGVTLKLAMLSSNDAPWHGLDRILRSLACYGGRVDVQLHVFGTMSESQQARYRRLFGGVTFHGEKSGNELDRALAEMTIALGSLALFRKGMAQACALKVREYTARGLPFVLGYDDPDLREAAREPFFLLVPNDDSLIDINEVVTFAERMRNDSRSRDLSERMRSYAQEHMDWRPKMKAYWSYVEGLPARAT